MTSGIPSGVPSHKEWLNTREVAEYLGVERTSIQRWCGSGYIRGVKIGKSWRIHRDELVALLKRSEPTGQPSKPPPLG